MEGGMESLNLDNLDLWMLIHPNLRFLVTFLNQGIIKGDLTQPHRQTFREYGPIDGFKSTRGIWLGQRRRCGHAYFCGSPGDSVATVGLF